VVARDASFREFDDAVDHEGRGSGSVGVCVSFDMTYCDFEQLRLIGAEALGQDDQAGVHL